MRFFSLFFLSLCLLTSLYGKRTSCGADDFVIDSYQLKERMPLASDPKTIQVLGEVMNPCTIDLTNSPISLRLALEKAGGITFAGDKRSIQIIRNKGLPPKIYTLAWQHIVRLPENSLLLMPGDILYIPPNPLRKGISLLIKPFKKI